MAIDFFKWIDTFVNPKYFIDHFSFPIQTRSAWSSGNRVWLVINGCLSRMSLNPMKGSHGKPEQETLYPHCLIGSWERIIVDINVRTFKEAGNQLFKLFNIWQTYYFHLRCNWIRCFGNLIFLLLIIWFNVMTIDDIMQ